MEMLIIALQYLRGIYPADPYSRPPSGFGRLFMAAAIIGLGLVALQSAADDRASEYGLSATAYADLQPLE
jgi:hypothetical protein